MLNVIYAECYLCWMSFTLSVTNKPFMLSVVMLNVISLGVIMLLTPNPGTCQPLQTTWSNRPYTDITICVDKFQNV